MVKKLCKVIGIGGTGAAIGATATEVSGLTAIGVVGGGIGLGTAAIVAGATGGGLLFLAGYGIYKAFKR